MTGGAAPIGTRPACVRARPALARGALFAGISVGFPLSTERRSVPHGASPRAPTRFTRRGTAESRERYARRAYVVRICNERREKNLNPATAFYAEYYISLFFPLFFSAVHGRHASFRKSKTRVFLPPPPHHRYTNVYTCVRLYYLHLNTFVCARSSVRIFLFILFVIVTQTLIKHRYCLIYNKKTRLDRRSAREFKILASGY